MAQKSGFALILGLATGVIAGLLLSPRSGKENRALLQKKAIELKDSAENAKETIEKVRNTVEKEIGPDGSGIKTRVKKIAKQVEAALNAKVNEIEGKKRK